MHPVSRVLFRPLLFPLLLALLAFVQYANTFQHDYAWDDKLVITSNPSTRKGLEGIPEIIGSKVSVPNKNVYRPVAQVVFALEVEAFGLNPHAGHVMSALWYALLCAVAYGFLRMVFSEVSPFLHFLCVGLFAVHPLHVEVVANIKSRDEILAMLFGLLSVMAILQGAVRERWLWVVGGILLMGLALLSKPNAITLLPVLLLSFAYKMHWHVLNRNTLLLGMAAFALLGMFMQEGIYWVGAGLMLAAYTALAPRKGWLPLSLAAVVGLFLALQTQAAFEPTDGYQLVSEASVLNNIFMGTDHPELVRPTALANMTRYLELFAYPHPLIHLYGYNQIPLADYQDPRTLIAISLLLIGFGVVVAGLARRSPLAFGILFFLSTFSIYSNYWVTVPDTMADRFMFMPSLGLSLIVVHLLSSLLEKLAAWAGKLLAPRAWYLLASLPVMVAFFVHGRNANEDWKNDHTLIHNRIAYMQENAAAQAMLGFVLHNEALEEGNPFERQNKLQTAMQCFHTALHIYPQFFTAWIESGKVFAETGFNEKAELCFLRAIQIEPLSPEGHIHLGTLYAHMRAHQYAIPYFEQALLLNPYHAEVMNQLGMAYYEVEDDAGLRRVADIGQRFWPQDGRFVNLMGLYHMIHSIKADSSATPPMHPYQGDSIKNF